MWPSLRRRTGKYLSTILMPVVLLTSRAAQAEPVRARYTEGTQHGYLALTTKDGRRIATGELVQVVEGDRVHVRLVYRFVDGSVDDEHSVFTQRGAFHLVRDHHVQKGPSFPHPCDVSIDTGTGKVITRDVTGGKGAPAETSTMELPDDLANGSIITILKNLDPKAPATKVSYLAAMPKPRVVKLEITPDGDDTFRVGSLRHKARCFVIKVDLGGVVGFIAPIIGKQPADVRVWIEEGEAPAFIREEGAFYVGGPRWIGQMAQPAWDSGHSDERTSGAKE